jgi:ankyrin repeat protein
MESRNGDTALIAVSRINNAAECVRLIAEGVNVNESLAAHAGVGALYIAAQNGQKEVVNILLAAGANVNQSRETNGETPLYIAVRQNHTEIVGILLTAKANAKSIGLLHIAVGMCCDGNRSAYSIVKQLIAAGADVNQFNQKGETPLHIAAMEDNIKLTKRLLIAGAQIDEIDKNGRTALHIAARCGRETQVEFLITNKADVNKMTTDGNTPLDMANSHHNNDIMKLIIKAGGKEGAKTECDQLISQLQGLLQEQLQQLREGLQEERQEQDIIPKEQKEWKKVEEPNEVCPLCLEARIENNITIFPCGHWVHARATDNCGGFSYWVVLQRDESCISCKQ